MAKNKERSALFLKICEKGHSYYKTANCNSCPECEKENKPADGFLSVLSAPARRALERENILTLAALSQYTEEQLLALHGLGKSSIPKLKDCLAREGFSLKAELSPAAPRRVKIVHS